MIEIGFEDRRQTEQGFDGDFDDFRLAFGEKPVDPDDFAVSPDRGFAVSDAVAASRLPASIPTGDIFDGPQFWLA